MSALVLKKFPDFSILSIFFERHWKPPTKRSVASLHVCDFGQKKIRNKIVGGRAGDQLSYFLRSLRQAFAFGNYAIISAVHRRDGKNVGELLIGDGPSNGGSRVNDKFLT